MSNISRREFLGRAGVTAAGVLVAPSLLEEVWENFGGFFRSRFYSIPASVKPLTPLAKRELIIARALDTPEGRRALYQAMTEPIKTSLSYQAIGRKLLMVDSLPSCGVLPRYERDIAVRSYVIPKRPSGKFTRVT